MDNDFFKDKKMFRRHLRFFVVVNLFLVFVNLFTNPNYFWFLWVISGWGIFLVLQYWEIYFEK